MSKIQFFTADDVAAIMQISKPPLCCVSSSLPQPLATPHLSTISIVCPFPECRTVETIQHLQK